MNTCFNNRLAIFLLGALCFTSVCAQASETSVGEITHIDIKSKMLINKKYSATVTTKNTGTTTWTRKNNITLSATPETNDFWRIPLRQLGINEHIKPGETKTFSVPIKALSRAGIFSLQFQLKQNDTPIGEKSNKLNIIIETRSNRVKFISQLLPNTMTIKEKYAVVVQFKNKGSSTWSRSKGYKLRVVSNKKPWDISRVKMAKNEIIPPGEIATFRFNLIAPPKPGNYPIQWKMQKGKAFFGEPTPLQKIVVTENKGNKSAEFIYQNIPGLKKSGKLYSVLNAGEVYPVTLTFKNNSDKIWRKGQVALSSQRPANNMTWSVDRIELKKNESIKPGGIKTFNFQIIAPLSPGIYQFQWQMIEGFNDWIGSKSENIAVTIN